MFTLAQLVLKLNNLDSDLTVSVYTYEYIFVLLIYFLIYMYYHLKIFLAYLNAFLVLPSDPLSLMTHAFSFGTIQQRTIHT